MPDFQILNDTVLRVKIQCLDEDRNVVPPPAGDVFTAVSTNPSALGAAVDASDPNQAWLVLTPLQQGATGIGVTVSDQDGLAAVDDSFAIVPDLSPKALALDLANAVTTPQPEPPASGGPSDVSV